MSTAPNPSSVASYVTRMASVSPAEALQIALAETERQQAIAATAQAEYKAMAEVEFDQGGRIVKATLGGLWRLAQMYAGSMIVPKHYQAKPNDCFIACQMAFRLRVDPFAYMQSSYVVYGKPGIEAKLSIAMLNTSGKITGRIRYREERDDKKVMTACEAYAFDAETGEEVSARITWQMAVAEGWVNKEGSKWKTMPEIMFHYRSATFLIRQYYPEVTMGMRTVDELEDMVPPNPANGNTARTLDDLTSRLEESGNGDGQVATAESGEVADNTEATTASPDHDPRPDPLLLDNAEAGFRACTELTEVGKFETECNGLATTDKERSSIAGMAGQARERIKAGRKGQKQGNLAGAT